MKWKILIPGAAVLAILVTALVWFLFFTGETNEDVLARSRPAFAARRKLLADLAGKLPPKGSVAASTGRPNLEPRPVYDPQGKNFNLSGVMYEQLLDPDRTLRIPDEVDLNLFEGNLLMHLRWTGPKNPMAESVRRSGARADLARELEATLKQPYLVVARTVHYDRPVVIPDQTFVGGVVDLEAFLVDLRSGEVVAAARVGARAEDVVRAVKGRAPDFIYSSMMGKLRTDLGQALAQTTGGTFGFELVGAR